MLQKKLIEENMNLHQRLQGYQEAFETAYADSAALRVKVKQLEASGDQHQSVIRQLRREIKLLNNRDSSDDEDDVFGYLNVVKDATGGGENGNHLQVAQELAAEREQKQTLLFEKEELSRQMNFLQEKLLKKQTELGA